MKLIFKQKAFSWLGAYEITDEKGNIVFRVKGQPSLTRTLFIYAADGNYLGKITEKMISITPHYKMYEGDREIGEVVKEISLARPKFSLDFNDWRMTGDMFKMNYKISDGGSLVMNAHKRALRVIDEVYELEVENPQDALYCVMIMLAMDAAKEKKEKQSK